MTDTTLATVVLDTGLRISGTVVDSTAIVGLTFRNGEDGIFATSRFLIEHCRIEECTDGIDYESGSGGICRYNVFERCTDDGIECDAVAGDPHGIGFSSRQFMCIRR